MWLERYEKEVDEMIKNQVRGREGLQGPDQERERTYVPNSALEYLAPTFIDLCIDTSLMRNCPTVSMSLTGTLQR